MKRSMEPVPAELDPVPADEVPDEGAPADNTPLENTSQQEEEVPKYEVTIKGAERLDSPALPDLPDE